MAVVGILGQTGGGGKRIVTGTFTGNGATSQSITGLSFEPTQICIFADSAASSTNQILAASLIDGVSKSSIRSSSNTGAIGPFTFSYSAGTLSMSYGVTYVFASDITYRYILAE